MRTPKFSAARRLRAWGGQWLGSGVLVLVACSSGTPADEVAAARKALDAQDTAAAVVHLKTAIQQDAGHAEARFLLGKALMARGDLRGAVIELGKALEAGHPAEEAVPPRALALFILGDLDRLLAEHGTAELKRPEAQAELKAVLAMALGAKGKFPAAQQAIAAARAADPGQLSVQLAAARLQAAQGDLAGATTQTDEILRQHEKSVPVLLLKADLLLAQSAPSAQVVALYQSVLEIDPKQLPAMAALAGIHGAQGELDRAREMLQRMQALAPQHPLTQIHAVLFELQSGQAKKAHELAQSLLKVANDHPRVLYLAGLAAFQSGALAESFQLLSRALNQLSALPPGNEATASIRSVLARIHLRQGEPGRALAVLRPLLDLESSPVGVDGLAAEAHLQLGDMKAAAASFERAARRNPADVRMKTAQLLSQASVVPTETTDAALGRLAAADASTAADMALVALRVTSRQWPQALQAIDAVERKQPGRPLTDVMRGRVELLRGDAVKARQHFDRALTRQADFMPAVIALAALDVREGLRDRALARLKPLAEGESARLEAQMLWISLNADAGATPAELVAMIQQAIQRHPNDVAPRIALVQAQMRAGNPKEALSAAQQAVAAMPAEPAVFDTLSRAQQAAGDFQQAMVAATKVSTLLPTSPQPLLRLAELSLAQGDRPGAVTHLQRALSLRKDFLPAQVMLAGLHASAGQAKEARAVAAQVQSQRPKEPAGWELSGDVERELRQEAAALAAYRMAMTRSPTTQTALKLYSALLQAGDTAQAQRLERQWLADHPGDMVLLVFKGQQAIKERELARAEAAFAEVVRLSPRHALALNNLAWVQWQAGQLSPALHHIDRALKEAPGVATFHDTRAAVLSAQGNLDEALKAQQRALSLDPGQAEHRLRLAELLAQAGRKQEARAEVEQLEKLGSSFARQGEVGALKARL